VPTIDHPADPRLDDYRHLTDAAARRVVERGGAGHGIFVVEGPVALEQLLRSGLRVRSVLLSSSRARSLEVDPALTCPVHVVERDVLAAVTGYDVHRGVLAAAERPAPAAPDELLGGARRVLVAEAVSDNENVGSLFRNAAALGVQAVLLDAACADPLYRRSVRVSSGWSMRIPFARTERIDTLLEDLRRHGVRSVALTPGERALDVDRAAAEGLLDEPVAFVVGAEGPGLSAAALDACDALVRVPMAPEVDSLNVATSFAVVASFAAARRRWS
jgi:tRNA G18 (ribose-2'-O)-methylase SpoU